MDKKQEKRYREYLGAELEAAAIYDALADLERDPHRADIFRRLAQGEMRHAARWAEKLGMDPSGLQPTRSGIKIRLLKWAAATFGTRRVLPFLLREEGRDINTYRSDPEAHSLVREERSHLRTLRRLANPGNPLVAMREEGKQLGGGGGSLRAAVLGVNDGLVSNFSLVMGVAGGTGDARFVLLAGVAGLLAGAFSMAAGEYVSMRSQREVFERQIEVERAELEEWPEEEEAELVMIYEAKGLSREEARRIARQIMSDREVALDTMAREELGLDPSELGSPWGASVSSFAAFVGGAIVPILPYIFDVGRLAFSLSAVLSAAALLAVGGSLAWLSNRGVLWGALRMLLAGGAAAAVTYGAGYLIGASLRT